MSNEAGAWMKRWAIIAAFVVLSAPAVCAEHYTITLSIEAPHDRAEAHSDIDPPSQGLNPRPVCHARRGDELTFQFILTSNFPHGTKKDVTIRYFIAPQTRAGKEASPRTSKEAVTEGTFVMDFKPDGRVGVRQRLHIDQAGAFLVRVQSEHSDSDHEHFAALDLVVE